MKTEKMIDWCLKKGGTSDKKHRGLRMVEPNPDKSKGHLRKAEHNMDFAKAVLGLARFNDWVFPASFYAAYHSCLAVLAYFGYESMNQECTFVLMENFETGKIDMTLDEISMIRKIGAESGKVDDLKNLREDFQYGLSTETEKQIAEKTIKDIEAFTLRVKGLLYRMLGE